MSSVMTRSDDVTVFRQSNVANPAGAESLRVMVESIHSFQDALSAAALSDDELDVLHGNVDSLTAWLAERERPEFEQDFGHRNDVPGRGQTMTPYFEIIERTHDSFHANVTFSRYYRGRTTVHGGAIALMFDEILGALAAHERPESRTAYSHVNFRSATPVCVPLTLRARFDQEESRKRYLVGELKHGETLCADAEFLFIATDN